MDLTRTARYPLTAAALVALAAACSSGATSSSPATKTPAPASSASPGAAAGLPNTPVGTQARWLLGAVPHAPLPNAEISAHFDQTFLTAAPASKLNAVFANVKSVKLDAVTTSTSDALVMTITENGTTQFSVSMATDSAGLIRGLLLSPAGAGAAAQPAVPTSWAGVERQIQAAVPQSRLLVARVSGGTCQPVQASGAGTPVPLGSAFKLYVLDALARAVAAGKVSWNQQLTVTDQLKSLPSGNLQNDPDGTKVTVRQAADAMISVSDNTAANMLMALLGRPAVEVAARDAGMAEPGLDVPFLSTRELLVLKLVDWPALANRYLAASPSGRQALLAGTIDKVPYATLVTAGKAAWNSPRDIGSLEWFASAADLCRVYAALSGYAGEPRLAPLAAALQINDGGLGLSAAQWPRVWFKGGSEPGVVTLNYLATTKAGQTYEVSVLTENPRGLISDSATASLVAAVKGAFQLAAS